jgi:UDP-N-acetylglucosamine diphosphorylase/glucosamine-1-phosphate N-acetyltransferase
VKLYLFDDASAERFAPFTLTRPVGELLFGCLRLRERTERALGLGCSGYLAASPGFEESGVPQGVTIAELPVHQDLVLLSGRAVLELDQAEWSRTAPAESLTLMVDDEVAGWVIPSGTAPPSPEQLADRSFRGSGSVALRGRLAPDVWTLMAENSERVAQDVPALYEAHEPELPDGVRILGNHAVSVGRGVQIEPFVVLDARAGPIRIDDEARLGAFLQLAGPAYVGSASVLFGGPISGVSLGPVCKVRGEIEETVILGFTNKAHDGFLGHAYLGHWVNLGALTTNSDLKNNYGPVRLHLPSGLVDTGLTKVGCFLGDHVKTGIGTMINTGTIVGAGSNLFGGAMPPSYVPPFSWGTGSDLTTYRLDKFLAVAKTVMGRRGIALSDGHRTWLERAWHASAPLRAGAFGA